VQRAARLAEADAGQCAKVYTDDIVAEATVEYLMMYRSDGTAAFVGLERIVGLLAGRAGGAGSCTAPTRRSGNCRQRTRAQTDLAQHPRLCYPGRLVTEPRSE
jgi:hypothetical protein